MFRRIIFMKRNGENIYRRKDGRWEGRYIKGRKSNGKLYYGYVYSRNYKEVKKNLFLFKLQYKENYLHDTKKINHSLTLQDWSLGWLAKQEKKVKPNTYISYESKMKNHIFPMLGDIELSNLTSSELQEVVDQLGEKLSISSLRAVFRVLRTCLNDAVKEERISSNPLDRVEFPTEDRSEVKAFTLEEQKRIIAAITDYKYLPILTAIHTGLRIGEISGLKWEDINWTERILYVRNNAQRVKVKKGDKHSKLVITSPKTALSQRVVPISDQLFEVLEISRQSSNSEFVFSSKGGPLDPRTIRNRFKKIKERAQVPDLPFHALRHTFATRCIESGVTVTTVSSLLGHKSTKMTLDIYTNSFITEKREAIAKIA